MRLWEVWLLFRAGENIHITVTYSGTLVPIIAVKQSKAKTYQHVRPQLDWIDVPNSQYPDLPSATLIEKWNALCVCLWARLQKHVDVSELRVRNYFLCVGRHLAGWLPDISNET
jgi:hypothetical protein